MGRQGSVLVLGLVVAMAVWTMSCSEEETDGEVNGAGGAAASSSAILSSSSSGDGGSGEIPLTGNWSCVGEERPPELYAGDSEEWGLVLQHYVDESAVSDATIRVCAVTDPDCASPASETTSDSSGLFTALVPPDKMHFVQVSRDDIPDHMIHLRGPAASMPEFISWVIFSQALINSFLAAAGETQDATRGMIAAGAADCDFTRAKGVTFEVDSADDDTKIVYFTGQGFPDKSLTATTETGEVGIANVPVGPTVVRVRLPNGEVAEERKIVVRANALSSTFWWPKYPHASW